MKVIVVWGGCLALEAVVLALLSDLGRVETAVCRGGGDRVGLGHLPCGVRELLLEGQLLGGAWL